MKQTFDFYIDEKVTIWNRLQYRVEAKSEEEARKLAIAEFDNPKYNNEVFKAIERLDDTEEAFLIEENEGHPTRELFFSDETKPTKTNLNK